jgi:acyl-CoA dehydrogenase
MLALERTTLPTDAELFRNEVRHFLSTELSDEVKEAANSAENFHTSFAERDIALSWQAKLRRRNWLAPKLPVEFGGPGWTPLQHFVFETEAGLAGAPFLPGFGLDYLAPILVKFGTPEQRQQLIPRILDGQDYWCQGFSEPAAGSDLAGLQCSARRQGDDYVVSGSKLWTTQGHLADHIFCLVRTSKEDRPQKGISFLLLDLRLPGVRVQPIRLIGGGCDVNQIFFDDVRVPATGLVGTPGEGWQIAKYLLELERGGFVFSGHIERRFRRLKALYSRESQRTGRKDEAEQIESRLAELDLSVLNYSHLELKAILGLEGDALRDAQASIIKIVSGDLHQRIDDLAVDILGTAARYIRNERPLSTNGPPIADRGYLQPFLPTMLNNRAMSILGGSHEIQKNLIARAVLR